RWSAARRCPLRELPQPRVPRLALVALEAPRGPLQHGAEDRARMSDQPEIDVAVLADRAVVHVDLHELELRADAPPVAHAKVEGRAHDDDDVGVGKGIAAGPIEVVRIARREKPAAAAIEVARDVEAPEQ